MTRDHERQAAEKADRGRPDAGPERDERSPAGGEDIRGVGDEADEFDEDEDEVEDEEEVDEGTF